MCKLSQPVIFRCYTGVTYLLYSGLILLYAGVTIFRFRCYIIGDGVNHVSLNTTFNWNFVNLCKPRQCLGLIVYWLCSV